MSVSGLLADLRRHGVAVRREGAELVIRAPAHALTADLRERLAAHKPALLAALAGALPPVVALADPLGPLPTAPCAVCGETRRRIRSVDCGPDTWR